MTKHLTLVQRLAAFASDVRDAGLDAALASDVTRRVRDLFGNCLGASGQEACEIVRGVADSWGGTEQAAVIGGTRRYPAATAALVNGTLAHAQDYDDTHLPSVLHPSAAVIPAALAVAEAAGANGEAFVAAVACGVEVCVRAGMAGYDEALGNSVFFEKGFHATSICGTLGAATAAALLWELDADGIAHAIGIAASMGAGIIEANRTGGSVKRVHCGWAAHAGVTAAQLASGGLTGPPTVFEGRFGFLHAYCDDRVDTAALLDGLGERWELPRVFFKPYPSNHFTHAGIDAALQLRADGVTPADVRSVELGVPTPTLRTIAEPAAEKAAPATGYAAKFSGPFTFALALSGGGGLGVAIEDFTDEAAADPKLRDLASRVTCVADPACDEIFPHQFPAIARVTFNDGTAREIQVLTTRGGPERPLSDHELARKFRDNASFTLEPDRIDALDGLLIALLELDDTRQLTDACRPIPASHRPEPADPM